MPNSLELGAAYKFIQYLDSTSAQDARAISAGDPPAVKAGYNSALYNAAPYYKQEQAVYSVVTPAPGHAGLPADRRAAGADDFLRPQRPGHTEGGAVGGGSNDRAAFLDGEVTGRA